MYRTRYPIYPRRPHKFGGARIKFRGKEYQLGPWKSPESYREFDRLLAEFHAAGAGSSSPAGVATGSGPLVSEVVAAWRQHLEHEYGPDRRENENFDAVLAALARLFGRTSAAAFDARALGRLRDALIDGSWLIADEKIFRQKHKKPFGWSRLVVNRNIVRVRTMWRWAEEQGMVPRGAWSHLQTLKPLPKNSSRVRTLPKRRAVEWSHVAKVLPHLSAVVAAMLEFQYYTGLRPGELCRVRADHLDQNAAPGWWLLALPGGKNDWREDHAGVEYLPVGPRAQALLLPRIQAAADRGDAGGLLFPTPQAQGKGRAYSPNSLGLAVRRGCDRAGVARFSSYQLRHLCKDRITKSYGLDAARAVLRQRSLGTTNSYGTAIDLQTAGRVMGEAG